MPTCQQPNEIDHKFNELLTAVNKMEATIDHLSYITHLANGMICDCIFECSACSEIIRSGNASVIISREVENHEERGGKIHIDVSDRELVATYCAECGDQYSDVFDMRDHLLEKLGLADGDKWGICDKCHCPLSASGSRVVLDLSICQVEKSADYDGVVEHIPILSRDILAFCPDCGNHMTRDILCAAMKDVPGQEKEE